MDTTDESIVAPSAPTVWRRRRSRLLGTTAMLTIADPHLYEDGREHQDTAEINDNVSTGGK